MGRNKRQIKESIILADKNQSIRFIFTTENCSLESLKNLDESVKRIKKELHNQFSFLILDSAECHVGKLIKENQNELDSLVSSAVSLSSGDPVAHEKKQSLDQNHICVWLSLDRLVRPINVNEFFRTEIASPPGNEYFFINWESEKSTELAGYILNQQSTDFLLNHPGFLNYPDLDSCIWYLRQNQLTQKYLTISHAFPYEPLRLIQKFRTNPVFCIKRWMSRNFVSVFQRQSSPSFPSASASSAMSRMLFFLVALLSLIILPVISFNAGISGDEEKHYMQAEKVYNYFATHGKDASSLSDDKYKLNYYGQSFDLFTYAVIKKLGIEKIYEARHVMNGALGAAAIVCSGLLARILFGNIAGIFTMLLLLFSPTYLGHAMNNPLDVPFAFGYIFSLLQLVRFLKRLPIINYSIAFLIALGIAFTISIRIGGLLLIPYIFMFSGLYLLFTPMPWKKFSIPWIKFAWKGVLILTIISVFAYFLSILPWPYARQNPLKNPFEAMKIMADISVSLRVMFEGKILWSDNLPSTYIPKNILLTVPILILTGFAASLLFIRKYRNAFWIFLLFFVVVFPVVYIIYKESNVYGAWRHLLFIYPPMVVLAGSGLFFVYNITGNRFYRYGILLLFSAAMFKPVAHIFRNYPNQYIYFNEFAGGVEKAYKKYETDYYMVSLKPGTEWLKENVLKNASPDSTHPIRIISNAPADIMKYYFREYQGKVKLLYTRYYDRGLYDWDYAVFFCNYIDPYQITHNIWPPKNTIHSVTIDGVKICAVVKRENKDDYRGFELLNNAMRTRNKLELDESIILMENALKLDKYNEITYLNLAQAYIMREEFDLSRKRLNELLSFYPNYEKALNVMGYTYLNEGEIFGDKVKIERAISLFNDVLKINYKFAGAYHNLGLAFVIKNDDDTAFGYFQKAIDNNASSKESYFMMANILEKRGDPQQAKEIREYARGL